MEKKRKVWAKEELVIAYYLAKWGLHGLTTTPYRLAHNVIGGTTVKSLDMQVQKFRFLLGLGKPYIPNDCELHKEIVKEFANKTISRTRLYISDYLEARKLTKNN